MFPSQNQIEKAAYERWERRGWLHGHHDEDWIAAEKDMTFGLNYRTIAVYSLSGAKSPLIGVERNPRCRFCERSAPRATFATVQPAVPAVLGNTALFTREICDSCADQFAGTIDRDLAAFWETVGPIREGAMSLWQLAPSLVLPIPAYKSLVRVALSLMPADDLGNFTDSLEWVSNSDHELDRALFGGLGSLIYQTAAPFESPRVSLTRRISPDAPFPYLLLFLTSGRLVLQTFVPLCSHDEDLDGEDVRIPERSFTTGEGHRLRAGASAPLPISLPAEIARPGRFRLFG
jgi:hypothetical protein